MHGRADAEAPPTIPDEAARMDDMAALVVMTGCGRLGFVHKIGPTRMF